MKILKTLALLLTFCCAWLLGGCMDITVRGPAPLEHTVNASVRQKHVRVGYVYCMRGWLGIFSTGMDALASEIDSKVSAPAVSVADEEYYKLQDWLVEEYKAGHLQEGPLVLLGHSYGADDQIRVAQHLKEYNIPVDLLVLIDPVTPPAVPDNVKRVYCLYFSHPATDWYPAWRGVPATVADARTPIVNIDLRLTDVGFDTSVINHINIEKVAGVHEMVMKEIEKTCPSRTAWLQMNSGTTGVVRQGMPAAAGAGSPVTVLPAGAPRSNIGTP
jgi:hypothetical protein